GEPGYVGGQRTWHQIAVKTASHMETPRRRQRTGTVAVPCASRTGREDRERFRGWDRPRSCQAASSNSETNPTGPQCSAGRNDSRLGSFRYLVPGPPGSSSQELLMRLIAAIILFTAAPAAAQSLD